MRREQKIPIIINKNLSIPLVATVEDLTKPFDALAVFRQARDAGCTQAEIVAAFAYIGLHFDGLPDPAAAQALDDLRKGWGP